MQSLFSKRLSAMSQANIRARANQVGKLELLVELFRHDMSPSFMSPLTKSYGSKHRLSLSHTAKTAAPSLTLFLMPFEIVFPLPSQSAVWQFSISSFFRPFNIDFVLFSCRHRSPRLHNRMAFPLQHFIFYRQEWQHHSQCAIIEITVWLGSQDTLLVDENLIAGFECSLEFRIKYTCCWNATKWEAA